MRKDVAAAAHCERVRADKVGPGMHIIAPGAFTSRVHSIDEGSASPQQCLT